MRNQSEKTSPILRKLNIAQINETIMLGSTLMKRILLKKPAHTRSIGTALAALLSLSALGPLSISVSAEHQATQEKESTEAPVAMSDKDSAEANKTLYKRDGRVIKTKEKLTNCPAFLNQSFRKLHSSDSVNLCSLYKGKPLLIVNTASHCGFTSQFKDLEAFYQAHRKKGVEVIGFASDSFNQEDKSEAKAADVCYKNYGVTFTMLAPTPVKGSEANAVFSALAEQSEAPKWNFNKYLLVPDPADANAVKVTRFESSTSPKSISF